MDLSKLPKFSETKAGDAPTPVARAATEPVPEDPNALPIADYASRQRRNMMRGDPLQARGPEAWISTGIGIVLLLMNPTFIKFMFAQKPYRPFADPTVDYTSSINFWSDLTITAFAFVLILEGIVLALTRNAVLVLIACAFTAAATTGNLLYLVMSYSTYGLALWQALAVIFGVYITIYEWRLYVALRQVSLAAR